MNTKFFTADHHFGHKNIIRFCERPFAGVDEMNEVLIQRWNEKVGPDDEVYHLGDLGVCRPQELKEILHRLNGKIYLIMGNHENAAKQNKERFEWMRDYCELKVPDEEARGGYQKIMHYAMRVWRSSHHGTWHLYGHSHGNLEDLNDQLSFDIGVDCHNFYPLSYAELKAIMAKKNWVPPYQREAR